QTGFVKSFGPHQRATWRGSVHAAKTSARGAANSRVITTARSGGVVRYPDRSAIQRLPCLQVAQAAVQAIEALVPEWAIGLHPGGHILQGPGIQAARSPLRLTSLAHQTGALQRLEVLRDGRQAEVEGRCQLGDGCLALGEAGQDRPSGGIREGMEGDSQVIGIHVASLHFANRLMCLLAKYHRRIHLSTPERLESPGSDTRADVGWGRSGGCRLGRSVARPAWDRRASLTCGPTRVAGRDRQ